MPQEEVNEAVKEMECNTDMQMNHSNGSDKLCDPVGNLKDSMIPSDVSSEEDVPKMYNKRVQRFSDSDSDSGKENVKKRTEVHESQKPSSESSDNDSDNVKSKNKPFKSRIQLRNPSDSDASDNALKNEEQQLRMKNKRNKMRDKFKSLVSARGKETSLDKIELEVNRRNSGSSSSDTDEDVGSIEKIKQKIKEKMSFKPSICDPDTSDEETEQRPMVKQKKERKIKSTSPKPQRMSAKQAMENMQKIKSESNRMLREKEVSLPYHRPKALSLKDIMSRRKMAVAPDGKALPIKMNEQQLQHYAQMLEERQKEMMELCKSESEEEDATDNITEQPTTNENTDSKIEENVPTENNSDELEPINNAKEIGEHIIQEESINNDNSENTNEQEKDGREIVENVNDANVTNEQDSESSMHLVYNDSANSDDGKFMKEVAESIEKENGTEINLKNNDDIEIKNTEVVEKLEILNVNTKAVEKPDTLLNVNTEDSQLISLHLDTEPNAINTEAIIEDNKEKNSEHSNNGEEKENEMEIDNFSDDELNFGDIDSIIENAEIIKDIEDKVNSQILIRNKPLNINPKLTGSPGMVIDLDVNDAAPRKSGVELLKERFTYFAKFKTPDEIEREKEMKSKPGTQLKKLKQELEDKIAEQRSLEWTKRLEEEEQQQKELKMLRGEESDEDIDKLDKSEEEIDNKDEDDQAEESESEAEEEPIEDDIIIKDKIKPKNAMVDDEAEESDCDEQENDGVEQNDNGNENEDDNVNDDNEDDNVNDDQDNDDDENDSESDESDTSESEDEEPSAKKKGRILKAFEDSDDENGKEDEIVNSKEVEVKTDSNVIENLQSQVASQDEEIQLAQRHKSASDDLFSQDSVAIEIKEKSMDTSQNNDTFTQTFSILESGTVQDLNSSGKSVSDTQTLEVNNIDKSLICPLTDSQKEIPLPSQMPATLVSQSQAIGEDILALCTGQFYNNEFVSQIQDQLPIEDSLKYDAFDKYEESQAEKSITPTNHMKENDVISNSIENAKDVDNENKEPENFIELNVTKKDKVKVVDDNLKSILDELDDPEFNSPKPNKFFTGSKNTQNDSQENQVKKKFIIESDDETNLEVTDGKNRKKLKKKKAEKRALQISDDEDDSEQEEVEEYQSDLEEENPDRVVDYDSEENEIEIKPQNPKKKRKTAEFFENEAELTSEDEWVGSGDEDEAGLDRMEREEGDDDTFHQGQLQSELGQIHMRDVMDQDKREVRIIQELLFEDGDLGAGGRQRKFRWKNIDGDEEMGTVPDEFADTQEEEFESEEQWRKQRHEREIFLRQMREKEDPDESLNVRVSRTAIIKANLNSKSKTMSSLLQEANKPNENSAPENKTKDIPSPKKPFSLMQQNFQGSLLSRGRGALARLAALATPLAADDDAKVGTLGSSGRRNFVFTSITPDEVEPKVTKRKAISNPGTPNLVKKMRIEEKNNRKNSLLDHIKV